MLVSSTGISMDLHYCQGRLKGASFIGKAKTCHDREASSSCHKKKNSCQHPNEELTQSEKDACCQNRTVHVEADDTEKNIDSYNVADQKELTASYTTTKIIIYQIKRSPRYSPQKYRPPPLKKNLPILLQVFRL